MKKRIMRLLPVLLALVMIFGSSLTVFAAEDDKWYVNHEYYEHNGERVNFADVMGSNYKSSYDEFVELDGYDKYVITQTDVTTEFVFYSNSAFIYLDTYPSGDNIKSKFVSSDNSAIYRISINNSSGNYSFFSGSFVYYYDKEAMRTFIKCSTHPIYGSASIDDLFMKAPTPTIPAIIVRKVEKTTMLGAIQVIKEILPICLVCLVGYLALRKALAVLQSLLHQA